MASVLENALLKKTYPLLYSSSLPSAVWASDDIDTVSLRFPYSISVTNACRKEIKSFQDTCKTLRITKGIFLTGHLI